MSRNTADITITTEGRDQGKTYRLTEMSASAAEDWAIRAFMAIAKGGAEIPDGIPQSIAGIAILGFKALVGADYATAKPLLDEMMGCVQVVTSAGIARKPQEEDIQEVATRLQLRKEVFEVHTGFFERAARLSSTTSASTAAAQESTSLNA
jgi:hypothetical protein